MGRSGRGEGKGALSFCRRTGETMSSTPPPLSGEVSSTDCPGEGRSIGTASGGRRPQVDRKKVEVVTVEERDARCCDDGDDVSDGSFLLEGKT